MQMRRPLIISQIPGKPVVYLRSDRARVIPDYHPASFPQLATHLQPAMFCCNQEYTGHPLEPNSHGVQDLQNDRKPSQIEYVGIYRFITTAILRTIWSTQEKNVWLTHMASGEASIALFSTSLPTTSVPLE